MTTIPDIKKLTKSDTDTDTNTAMLLGATQKSRVISLGQIIVDIPMKLERLPEPGGDIFAHASALQVGASFNTLFAAHQMGADVYWAGVCGKGNFADLIIRTLKKYNINHIGNRDLKRDSGFCIALTDSNAERTFISTRGAEAYGDIHTFDHVNPLQGDVVHISGYTLAHPICKGLIAFLERTKQMHNKQDKRFTALFDTSPMIYSIDRTAINAMINYHPIWSCNEKEALLLSQRFNLCSLQEKKVSYNLLSQLQYKLNSTLIVRVGSDGAWLCEQDKTPILINGFPTKAIDTNGAGDTHAGVLANFISEGMSLKQATLYANAAASIAVTRLGPATCPTRKEVKELVSSRQ